MSIAPRTPRAGLMAGSALIRSEPADFRVDERIEMAQVVTATKTLTLVAESILR